jgi:hypothetical protein
MFYSGVQNRLELVTSIKAGCSEWLTVKALIKLHEINQKINKVFKIPLMICLGQVHLAFLIGCYWIGVSFLGHPFEYVYDVLVNCTSCLLILILFGKIDRQTQKFYRKICFQVPDSRKASSQCEDSILIWRHYRFSMQCFGVIDGSFATTGQVSLVLKPLKVALRMKTSTGFGKKFRVACNIASISDF